MTSALAQQLKQIQASALKHGKVRASFLFDQNEASDYDMDTIYALGINGLLELAQIQPRFQPFEETLFSESMKSFDRIQQTKEVNDKLDDSLAIFLQMISPYFLLKPAHKALEWLIRRFRINELNVNAVVACILPYHSSLFFLKMVHVLRIPETGTSWSFLRVLKKNNVPLDTQTLVQRCISDPSILQFICESVKASTSSNDTWKNLYAYYASTVLRVLQSSKQVDDAAISPMLPYVIHGLKQKYHVDYQLASYAIIMSISSRVLLKPAIVSSFVNLVLLNANAESHALESLTCVLSLLATQPVDEFPIFPPKIIHLLAFSSSWTLALDNLAASYNVDAFTSLLVRSIVHHLHQQEGERKAETGDTINNSTDALNLLLKLNLGFIPKNNPVSRMMIPLLKCLHDITKMRDAQSSSASTATLLLRQLARQNAEIFDQYLSTITDKQILGNLIHHVLKSDALIAIHHPSHQVREMAIQELLTRVNDQECNDDDILSFIRNEQDEDILTTLLCQPELKSFAFRTEKTLRPILLERLSNSRHINLNRAILVKLFNLIDSHSLSTVTDELDILIASLHMIQLSDQNVPVFIVFQEILIEQSKSLSILSSFIIDTTTLMALQSKDFLSTMKKSERQIIYGIALHQLFKQFSLKIKSLNEAGFLYFIEKISFISSIDNDPWRWPMAIYLLMELSNTLSAQFINTFQQISSSVRFSNGRPQNMDKTVINKENDIIALLVRKSPIKEYVIYALYDALAIKMMNLLKQHSNDNDEKHDIFQCILPHSHLVQTFIEIHLSPTKMTIPFMVEHATQFPDNQLIYDLLNGQQQLQQDIISLLPLIVYLSLADKVVLLERLLPCLSIIPSKVSPFISSIVSAREAKIVLNHSFISSLFMNEGGREEEALMTFINKYILNPKYTPCILALLSVVSCGFKKLKSAMDLLLSSSSMQHSASSISLMVAICEKIKPSEWNDKSIFDHLMTIIDIPTVGNNGKEDCTKVIDTILAKLMDVDHIESIPLQKKLLSTLLSMKNEMARKVLENFSFNNHKVLLNEWHTWHLHLFHGNNKERENATKKSKSDQHPLSISIEDLVVFTEILLIHAKRGGFHPSWMQIMMEGLKELNQLESNTGPNGNSYANNTSVEYLKQLELNIIEVMVDGMVDITQCSSLPLETIMNVLRTSTFVTTHTTVIKTMSKLASMIPEQVIHVLLPLFTFMGTHLAKQDDAYTFGLLEMALKELFPVVISSSVGNVLSAKDVVCIFVDAWSHMPKHRRFYVFKTLVDMMMTHSCSFSLMMEQLLEKCTFSTSSLKLLLGEVSNKDGYIAFLLELCQVLPIDQVISSLSILIESLNEKLHHLSTPQDIIQTANTNKITNGSSGTNKNNGIHNTVGGANNENTNIIGNKKNAAIVNHGEKGSKDAKESTFKFAFNVIVFIQHLLTDEKFLNRMMDEKARQVDHVYLETINTCLAVYTLSEDHRLIKTSNNTLPVSFYKTLSHFAEESLACLYPFISTANFHTYLLRLVTHPTISMKHRALSMLSERLHRADTRLISLSDELTVIVEKTIASMDKQDMTTCQTALLCLELMVTTFGAKKKELFMEILGRILKVASLIDHHRSAPNMPVRITLLVCLAAWCTTLKSAVIPCLNDMMSLFIAEMTCLLKDDLSTKQSLLLQQSALTALHKVILTVPQFLSKYLNDVVSLLIHHEWSDAMEGPILLPLLTDMSERIPVAHLIVSLKQVYEQQQEVGTVCHPERLVKLFGLLEIVCKSMDAASMTTHHTAIVKFIVDTFSTRERMMSGTTLDNVESIGLIEKAIFHATITYSLRLNDQTFMPFFNVLGQWAENGGNDEGKNDAIRWVTFYAFMEEMTRKLKSLFIPYVIARVNDMVRLLDHSDEWHMNDKESAELWMSIVGTLYQAARFDSGEVKLCQVDRINMLIRPLLDQMDNQGNSMSLLDKRMKEFLIPCLTQMAVVVHDDQVWKMMTHEALLKTRSDSWLTRLYGLSLVKSLYARLGEEFLILLPESIPFLAELMEDDNEQVEKLCQETVAVIEQHLGEPLQKYFN